MPYKVFVRNWYKKVNGKLVPDYNARKKTIRVGIRTEKEAREECKKHNDTHAPGILSRKAEYTSY